MISAFVSKWGNHPFQTLFSPDENVLPLLENSTRTTTSGLRVLVSPPFIWVRGKIKYLLPETVHTCVRSWCNWSASCVVASQKNKKIESHTLYAFSCPGRRIGRVDGVTPLPNKTKQYNRRSPNLILGDPALWKTLRHTVVFALLRIGNLNLQNESWNQSCQHLIWNYGQRWN